MYSPETVWQFYKYDMERDEFVTSKRWGTEAFIRNINATKTGKARETERRYVTEAGATVKDFDFDNPVAPIEDGKA